MTEKENANPAGMFYFSLIDPIIKASKNKTNEEIADLGNVSVEKVENIRKQLEQEQIKDRLNTKRVSRPLLKVVDNHTFKV